MQVEDIKIMDETATDRYGTRELNENFNRDFEMSVIENEKYINDLSN